MGRRIAIALAAASITWLLSIATASACSCAPVEIDRQTFRQSDGAIIGKFLERVAVSDAVADYRYRVKRVFRGRRRIDEGSVIAVRSSASGASCGLETPVGGREGLFLGRSPGRWSGSLCATTTPRKMRRAAERTGFARTRGCS